MNQYNKLKEYHKIHSHCKVNRKENKPLCQWVNDQRKQRKKSSPKYDPEKIKLLDQIGFQWESYVKKSWDDNYQELVEYKKKMIALVFQEKENLNVYLIGYQIKRSLIPKKR